MSIPALGQLAGRQRPKLPFHLGFWRVRLSRSTARTFYHSRPSTLL